MVQVHKKRKILPSGEEDLDNFSTSFLHFIKYPVNLVAPAQFPTLSPWQILYDVWHVSILYISYMNLNWRYNHPPIWLQSSRSYFYLIIIAYISADGRGLKTPWTFKYRLYSYRRIRLHVDVPMHASMPSSSGIPQRLSIWGHFDAGHYIDGSDASKSIYSYTFMLDTFPY